MLGIPIFIFIPNYLIQLREFTIFVVIIFFFFKPAISLPEPFEALNLSLNISGFHGDVHGKQAIVYVFLQVRTVDRGAPPW
jgi:hypothetical protein